MVLDRVLAGRIVFTPTASGDAYMFEAPTRFDRLFSGFASAPLKDPIPDWMREFENEAAPVFGPEDTMDGDYGRLLGRAMRKLRNRSEVASPPPASWNHIVSWLRQIEALRDAA